MCDSSVCVENLYGNALVIKVAVQTLEVGVNQDWEIGIGGSRLDQFVLVVGAQSIRSSPASFRSGTKCLLTI